MYTHFGTLFSTTLVSKAEETVSFVVHKFPCRQITKLFKRRLNQNWIQWSCKMFLTTKPLEELSQTEEETIKLIFKQLQGLFFRRQRKMKCLRRARTMISTPAPSTSLTDTQVLASPAPCRTVSRAKPSGRDALSAAAMLTYSLQCNWKNQKVLIPLCEHTHIASTYVSNKYHGISGNSVAVLKSHSPELSEIPNENWAMFQCPSAAIVEAHHRCRDERLLSVGPKCHTYPEWENTERWTPPSMAPSCAHTHANVKLHTHDQTQQINFCWNTKDWNRSARVLRWFTVILQRILRSTDHSVWARKQKSRWILSRTDTVHFRLHRDPRNGHFSGHLCDPVFLCPGLAHHFGFPRYQSKSSCKSLKFVAKKRSPAVCWPNPRPRFVTKKFFSFRKTSLFTPVQMTKKFHRAERYHLRQITQHNAKYRTTSRSTEGSSNSIQQQFGAPCRVGHNSFSINSSVGRTEECSCGQRNPRPKFDQFHAFDSRCSFNPDFGTPRRTWKSWRQTLSDAPQDPNGRLRELQGICTARSHVRPSVIVVQEQEIAD